MSSGNTAITNGQGSNGSGTGGEDASPPTKRVKVVDNENDNDNDVSSPIPAFLTPPTSATIPGSQSSNDADDDDDVRSPSSLNHKDLSRAIGREDRGTAAPAVISRETSPPSSLASSSPSSSSSDVVPSIRAGGTSSTVGTNNGNGGGGGGCDSGRHHHCLSRDEIRTLLLNEAKLDVDDPNNEGKRTGYLAWDDYFLAVAQLSSQRSKDPHVQVGACIVDGDNRIVGIGYNGFPRGCSDDCLPWAANETEATKGNQTTPKPKLSTLQTRDPYMCHAEINAILNKCSADVVGARMYVARYPCNECAKMIIQSGIREVVYLQNDDDDSARSPDASDAYRAARIMFEMAGVTTRRHRPTNSSVTLDFGPMEEAYAAEEEEEAAERGKEEGGGSNGRDDAISEQAKYRGLLLKEAGYDPTKPVVPKRTGYLSWDAYFMSISFLSAQRSKDPNTQVGACIVDSNKCIVGIGYNGFPRGCSDECLPWSRKADSALHKKYAYVCHAEVNAILNKCSADVRGATLYVALFPCNECAKVIIQSGIREVVYLNDRYHDTDGCRASRIMFRMAGVKLRHYRPKDRFILVKLDSEMT